MWLYLTKNEYSLVNYVSKNIRELHIITDLAIWTLKFIHIVFKRSVPVLVKRSASIKETKWLKLSEKKTVCFASHTKSISRP
jgi:hypothetical protein